jgi:predicted SprT family Zn-dependent metalloprotease
VKTELSCIADEELIGKHKKEDRVKKQTKTQEQEFMYECDTCKTRVVASRLLDNVSCINRCGGQLLLTHAEVLEKSA